MSFTLGNTLTLHTFKQYAATSRAGFSPISAAVDAWMAEACASISFIVKIFAHNTLSSSKLRLCVTQSMIISN